jgi:hypothetical protein
MRNLWRDSPGGASVPTGLGLKTTFDGVNTLRAYYFYFAAMRLDDDYRLLPGTLPLAIIRRACGAYNSPGSDS